MTRHVMCHLSCNRSESRTSVPFPRVSKSCHCLSCLSSRFDGGSNRGGGNSSGPAVLTPLAPCV